MHLSQLYFFHILALHHLAKLFVFQIPFTVFNFPTYSDFFNRLRIYALVNGLSNNLHQSLSHSFFGGSVEFPLRKIWKSPNNVNNCSVAKISQSWENGRMKKRISHYQSVAEIAYATAKRLLPLYHHKNSPHRFTWPQLAACVLITYYLDCSYQDMEDWLLVSDTICRSLDLQEVPDHTTLCRAFHQLDICLLRAMQRLLLQKSCYERSRDRYWFNRFSNRPSQCILFISKWQTQKGLDQGRLCRRSCQSTHSWHMYQLWTLSRFCIAQEFAPSIQIARNQKSCSFGRCRIWWQANQNRRYYSTCAKTRDPSCPRKNRSCWTGCTGTPRWALWTTLEMRDRALGYQTEVRWYGAFKNHAASFPRNFCKRPDLQLSCPLIFCFVRLCNRAIIPDIHSGKKFELRYLVTPFCNIKFREPTSRGDLKYAKAIVQCLLCNIRKIEHQRVFGLINTPEFGICFAGSI